MRYLALFILLFLFWLLLTFQLTVDNLIVGGICALITTLFFGRYFSVNLVKFLQPSRYFWSVIYLFVFIWECIKSNFDVAYRVLHPDLPIKPGIVKVKMTLKTDMARMMLANSITMTPGTITVDIIGDYIYVHWIYVRSTDPEIFSKEIAGKFETYLKRIFE
jgi:multicomponent Na+:H+ antiporter subunit E